MAFDFPSSPTVGQVFGAYTWDGEKWVMSNSALAPVVRGQLSGLTLSTPGSSVNFSVAVGIACDSTHAVMMTLSSTMTKHSGGWVQGGTNGALDTGGVAANTWYHVFQIMKTDKSAVDILISLSPSAPTMPAGWTYFRRIGSLRTNASSQWTLFTQRGDEFLWDLISADVSGVDPTTAGILVVLGVPTGVQVNAIISILFYKVSGGTYLQVTSPDQANSPTSSGNASLYSNSSTIPGTTGLVIRTNTASQIRLRQDSANGNSCYVNTSGWIDRRGRDA